MVLLSTSVVLVSLISGCGDENAYVAPPPPEVTVTSPERRPVTSYLEYTGTTQAVESVDIRARVKGFLKERHFKEGSDVKKGQLLLTIDEEPFRVQLELAKANLAEAEAALKGAEQSKAREVAQAQLALDQSLLVLARIEETRARNLVQRQAGSREEFDRAEANRKKSEAQIEADRASVEQTKADYETNILAAQAKVDSARSAVRSAEIDLGYCKMYSPIDGRISRALVDVGNLVGDAQNTVLATIVKTDPIYAYMSVSEADLLQFRKMVREGKRADYRTEAMPLELGLANEQGFPHMGQVDYTDPGIDPGTGTIRARGIFPNPDGTIVPGLFVRLRVPFETKGDALLVPERALGADQAGRYLLVVGKDNVVERRAVEVGTGVGGLRVVEGKIGPNDLVVVEGLQRARPGLKVNPKPVAADAPRARPRPRRGRRDPARGGDGHRDAAPPRIDRPAPESRREIACSPASSSNARSSPTSSRS